LTLTPIVQKFVQSLFLLFRLVRMSILLLQLLLF
jgi:hypothetical protein